MKLLIKWLLSALALLCVAYLYSGVEVRSFGAALIAALLIGWAQNRPDSAESPPVTTSAGRTGGSYPAARNVAKPGRFCEAMVTR